MELVLWSVEVLNCVFISTVASSYLFDGIPALRCITDDEAVALKTGSGRNNKKEWEDPVLRIAGAGGNMNQEMAMVVRRNEEREALRSVIAQWNANRLDLFELSEPNQELEFHGVMRFYFQEPGQTVVTKCLRVASDATAQVVIETLIEKFRPDMRMLSVPEYALYEIHENGDERRLEPDEKPLLVQLNWHKDDREGRFLLRRIDDKTNMPEGTFQEGGTNFRRKLSKREKKQLKKQEKLNRMKSTSGITNDENDSGVAEKLYTELPETSFTRSISNPEAVMRRRRQQQLERKLQQFRSKDGGPDTGGTLKIYGEALCKDVPYKTLLLSIGDTATQVVREMLAKYGLDKEEPLHYCLVQVNSAIEETRGDTNVGNNTLNQREYILDDDECPLAILMNHPLSRGSIMFHVRRRPADYHPRKRKKKPQGGKWAQNPELLDYRYEDGLDRLPFFLELNPDGSEIAAGTGKRYRLGPNVTEVGSERGSPHGHGQSLQLFGPNIQPRHCVIAHTEGIVTVTPCSRDAETYVNGQRIYETTILQNGASVKFGRIHNFRYLDPCHEERTRQRYDSSRSPHDYSYDRQSTRDETSSLSVTNGGPTTTSTPSGAGGGNPLNYETTFDVDGNVETRSTSSTGNKEDTRSQRSIGSSREGNRLVNYDRYAGRGGSDPILPAVLEIREETEEALLHALITDLDPSGPGFKLAPAYTLYLMARYRASTHYRPELTPTERAHRLTLILHRVATIIHDFVQEKRYEVRWLSLWLANASELLHFLKSDRHISAFSIEAQNTLADAVQISFKYLVSCLQGELSTVMPNFLSDRDDLSHDPEDSSTVSVLGVLSSAMTLLRRCRVNAALTIQLFSQLFHYVNVWAFNRVVAPGSPYCSRAWGLRLKARLAQVEVWAERQGLELAADCHLARIIQAAHLLQAPKYNCDDLATLSSTCFKLNSLQLRALLQNYQPTPDEPRIPHDIVDNVVRVAENLADELARSDGREVRLEEDPELALPFLLPDDGYSCEVVRGVPPGLVDFLAPLQAAGLCRLTPQPSSNGLWTVYMAHLNSMVRSPSAMSNRSLGFVPPQHEPEVQIIKLHKSNNGMGLSIVAAKGAGQEKLGIYIKSVVKGGAADADGRLQAGDQLLKVDGQSLVGITQEKAAEYLVRTGPVVTLEVAKQGAIYHGLATLLSRPSPVLTRACGPQLTYLGQQESDQQRIPKSVSMGNFEERFTYEDIPDEYMESVRPGSPTVLRIHVPVITMTPPPPKPILPINLLSVPEKHPNCYKLRSESELGLHEDVFQEHQARLVNCDFDDASAILRRVPTQIDLVRNPQENIDERVPDWFLEKLERTKKPVPARWYPVANSKTWRSDIFLSKSGVWEMVDGENKSDLQRRSMSVDCILDSSSSECDCMVNRSPQSTDSQGEHQTKRSQQPAEDDVDEEEAISKRKLSAEEREKALKELDEIVSGIDRITEFANKDLNECEGINKVNNFLASMLSVAEPPIEKTEVYIADPESSSYSSSNSGDFEYGTGRVAALAKHFSELGEAGIIRGKNMQNKGLKCHYRSEPNINSCDSIISPRPGDIILPPAAFDTNSDNCELVLSTKGLKPVGFSMDRLIDLGHGVIMKEMKSDIVNLNNNNETKEKYCNFIDCTPINKNRSTQTSPLVVDDVRGKELSLSETALYDKNNLLELNSIKNGPIKSAPSSLPFINVNLPEDTRSVRAPRLNFTRKSISVDEVEMRRRSQSANSHKHFSMVDLGEANHIDNALTPNQSLPLKTENPSNFCPSEGIHRAYIGDPSSTRHLKRWMSMDESIRSNGWTERLKEKERLDLGTSGKDSLRRKCRLDAIKERKVKRNKKLELERRLVVTPVRLSQMSALAGGSNTLWCHPGTSSERPQSSPRRMSERDLPSRVLSEQAGRGQLPPHAPQIHSSKSVPSLNTGNHEFERPNLNQTVIGNSTMPRPNHEVFNPGYSRTSSTNSIPQKSYEGQPHPNPHQIRSRSNQNLADHRQGTLAPNHIGSRQPSNPNLVPNNYNNHQPTYQQQPLSPYQQHHPPLHISYQQPVQQQQQNSPSGENGERFYQNLSIYRNQENGHIAQNGVIGRGKMPSPQEDRGPIQTLAKSSLRGSQSSLQSRSTEPSSGSRDRPASAYLPNNYPNHLPPQGMTTRSQSSRDVLRQEAKFQEMTEEVRRREMRSPHHRPPMGSQTIQGGSPLRYSGYPVAGDQPAPGYRLGGPDYVESPPPPPPPPTSTHPLYQPLHQRPSSTDVRYAASVGEPPRGSYQTSPSTQASRQYYYQGSNPWQREEREKEAERRRDAARHWRDEEIAELSGLPSRNPQQEERLRALRLEKEFEKRAEEELEEEEEEDHDTTERVQGLLRVAQQNDEDNRSKRNARTASQSTSGPTQVQYHQQYTHPGHQQQYTAASQQQQQQQQQQAAQQQYTAAAAQQTPQQQLYTATSQQYTATPQQYTPTSQQYTPTSQQYPATSQQYPTSQNPTALMNGTIGRTPVTTVASNYPHVSAEEKARLQRLKDLKMKQAEVEAERMKKKQEEEARNMSNNYQTTSRVSTSTSSSTLRTPPSTLRLDNLVINSPPNNNHYHNNNGYSSSQASPPGGQGGPVGAPQPPERGSSFAVAQSLRSPSTPTMATAKRVSFQEPTPPVPAPAQGSGSSNPPSSQLTDIREDPNNFINEAETMLASPTSPDTPFTGNTPGVIGAQEVYKDPRQRRLAEQQHQKLLSNKGAAVPEKLSFKEKMKMFAMETGEDGTPKDKVKISRAQRDIDNIGSPNNNNANAQQ